MKKISFWPIWNEIQKVRETKWKKEAIKLANEYITKDPSNIQAYMQLIDIYYVVWDLEKAEKPIDFILSKNIQGVEISLLHYVKAVLLSEKTEWIWAKKHIKLALKKNKDNLEYQRLLSTIEFWSWNKTEWYKLLKDVLSKNKIDPDVLLDAVSMALSLWYVQEAKDYVNIYFNKKDEISFFSKSKAYYDKKMLDFKEVLFHDNKKDE